MGPRFMNIVKSMWIFATIGAELAAADQDTLTQTYLEARENAGYYIIVGQIMLSLILSLFSWVKEEPIILQTRPLLMVRQKIQDSAYVAGDPVRTTPQPDA